MTGPKRVAMLLSGPTDAAALGVFLAKLFPSYVFDPPRFPPNHRTIGADWVRRECRITHQRGSALGAPPDKVIVLVDADASDPVARADQIAQAVGGSQKIPVWWRVVAAKWHLEAWCFGDEQGLRKYLKGKALGHVDSGNPDEIVNPKQHLRNLLAPRAYTTEVAKEIAMAVNLVLIKTRSESFRRFTTAVENGGGS